MRIAIVKLSALGDIVQSMVVLQFIKKLKPDLTIDWIIEDSYKDLLKSNSDINHIHVVKIKNAKNKKSIKLLFIELMRVHKIEPYDLVIDMQGLIKSAIIARIIPSKVTLGYDKNSLRESFAAIFYNKKFAIDYSENIIKRNFSIVMHALGLPAEIDVVFNKLPFLFSSNHYYLDTPSNNKKNILLIVGASFQSKCYPFDRFIELINSLDANYFVAWNNAKERTIAFKIKSEASNLIILQKLSLDELISVTGQMNLVIGPDTGPTHIAWGLNVPSITIFGPTPGYRNCFVTDINKVVESKTKVNPYKVNKNDFSIKNIEVSDIVKISQKLLEI